MHDVRDQVSREYTDIKKLFQKYFPYYQDGKLERFIFHSLNRRLNTISVRSSFVFLAYNSLEELAQRNGNEFRPIKGKYLKKIAFLADAAMSVMYMYNHFYDGKYGVDAKRKENNTLIAANVLKDLVYRYSNKLPDNYSRVIHEKLSLAYMDVELGQYMDKNYDFEAFVANQNPFTSTTAHSANNQLLRIRQLIANLKRDYPDANNTLDVYFTRIYLINSSLLRALVDILIELTAYEGDAVEYFQSFAELMGIYMQIVNDNTDFVFDNGTNNKKASDTLSDLRNETISLPIILHYHSGITEKENKIKQYVDEKIIRNIDDGKQNNFPFKGKHNEVLKEVIESRALGESIQIGRKVASAAKEYFTSRIEAPEKSNLKKLVDMTDLAKWNRYYYHVKKAKPFYNRGELYRCEDHLSIKKVKV